MPDIDKNILITPNRGATSQPNIIFTGQGVDPITLRVLDGVTGTGLTAGGAISFEGSAGQLFSIVNRLGTGSIFSVNDISGIPSIDVDASGRIVFAGFTGNVGVGATLPAEKLDVAGNIRVNGNATFLTTTAGITGMYWRSSTGRLGIGLTAPTMALDVIGSGEFTGDVFVTTNFIKVTNNARHWFL